MRHSSKGKLISKWKREENIRDEELNYEEQRRAVREEDFTNILQSLKRQKAGALSSDAPQEIKAIIVVWMDKIIALYTKQLADSKEPRRTWWWTYGYDYETKRWTREREWGWVD